MNFEEYLSSKKIDSALFKAAEPGLWESWKKEYGVLSPSSFTSQKLYLINPVRRKYQLKQELKVAEPGIGSPAQQESPIAASPPQPIPRPAAKPAVPKPVFKPKPKID